MPEFQDFEETTVLQPESIVEVRFRVRNRQYSDGKHDLAVGYVFPKREGVVQVVLSQTYPFTDMLGDHILDLYRDTISAYRVLGSSDDPLTHQERRFVPPDIGTIVEIEESTGNGPQRHVSYVYGVDAVSLTLTIRHHENLIEVPGKSKRTVQNKNLRAARLLNPE